MACCNHRSEQHKSYEVDWGDAKGVITICQASPPIEDACVCCNTPQQTTAHCACSTFAPAPAAETPA